MRKQKQDPDEVEPIEIEGVKCIGQTQRAIRVAMPDGEQRWIPQSQITPMSEVYELGTEGKLIVTAWFARKEGLA